MGSASESTRLAVFDCDGTLVDSQHSIISSMQAAFSAHDHAEPTAESIRRVVGLPLKDAIALMLPESNSDTHELLRDGYKDAFSQLRKRGQVREPLFPGAVESLEELSDAGWMLGVATGKGLRGLLSTLNGHGLTDRFDTLQTADVAQGKPSPDMLFRAMSDTGTQAGDTVMIGDTTFDMEMAVNAGTKAIGVAWGYHPVDELSAAGAHVIVEGFDGLSEAIKIVMEGS